MFGRLNHIMNIVGRASPDYILDVVLDDEVRW